MLSLGAAKKKKKKHLLASMPIRQERPFFSFFFLIDTSICPMPRRRSLKTKSKHHEGENKSPQKNLKMTNSLREGKSFDEIMFGLFCSFYDVSVSSADIRRQSDMKHGKLSPNPIWNGWDKVPGKFRGTERAEGGKGCRGRKKKEAGIVSGREP